LIVEGTSANDTIAVNPTKDPSKLAVIMNKVSLGQFSGVSIIDVRAGVGADRVTVSPKTTKSAILDGGPATTRSPAAAGTTLSTAAPATTS
jgi:hypothetical protein